MNLRFINITAKAGDNDNLRHQTLEAHPLNSGHSKSHDDDDDDNDVNGPLSNEACGFGGNGENDDGDEIFCDSFAAGCVIQDNDPRVHYSGPWVLEGTELSTTHNTVVEGSTVSLIFNGSAIIVFGTVPASNQSEPPTVAYFLDTLPPSITTLPQATADTPNQPLYSSLGLSPDERHRLFINVTKIQPETPYALTSFSISPVLCPRNSQSPQTTSPMATSSTAPVSASPITMPDHKTIIIVAGVLSSLVFLFIVAILVFLIVRWGMYARRERVHSENSTTPATVYSAFTTTESILRNDSSIWSQAPSHPSFSEASSRISRPAGSDFLLPSCSELARPREARLSAIKFALPPHSKSLSTL